jgi:hypothetical protein
VGPGAGREETGDCEAPILADVPSFLLAIFGRSDKKEKTKLREEEGDATNFEKASAG